MMARTTTSRRFTLVEMLIVIAIIIVLATILGGVMVTSMKRAANEAQANQIKLILSALDQFKNDFSEYPSVDAGNATKEVYATGGVLVNATTWAEHNTLAYRLCQKEFGSEVDAPNFERDDRRTWAGTYLTREQFPVEQVKNNELLDRWTTKDAQRPLAYCMAPDAFFKNAKKNQSPPNVVAGTNKYESWANNKNSTLATSITENNTAGTDGKYFAYRTNANAPGSQWYARPMGGSNGKNGFMGPNGYAMRGQWNNLEVNMPEVWSMGSDMQYSKIQYNSGNEVFNIKTVGAGSTNYYYDQDNVGGNVDAMKIQ